MLKQRKNQTFLIAGAGFCALIAGAAVAVIGDVSQLPSMSRWLGANQLRETTLSPRSEQTEATSMVTPLVSFSPAERMVQLESLAKGTEALDRDRARFLLASDLIQQGQAGSALPWLEGLEEEYPVLAAQILLRRAQAYTATGNQAQAQATWQELLQRYPDDPTTAEALFALGKTDPQYWQQAIARFPAHPRSVEIAQTQLQENPNQLPLLLLVARHGLYLPEITSVLDRLSGSYASQLKPEDWEAIAFGYWEKQSYRKAGIAYSRAPRTPLNAYRTGRGLQLGQQGSDALQAYYQLTQQFPDAKETATALLRMATLTSKPENALQYLDAVINRFPDRAGEALLARAEVLEQMGSPQSASQARQSVLTQHSKSDAAAELRWQQAQRRAERQDFQGAWEWARQIPTENPESEFAAEAAFWAGKWADRLGQQQTAQTAFEYVLTHYPESYYAWRSATILGWDVGNFTTVRQKTPEVARPMQRPQPPAGSPALQELYLLGQNRDAWSLWQVEFKNPVEPTVAEQFTDGLIRLGIGDNLDGIFMVSSLSNRETPEEKSEYQELKQQSIYWQALYPFPFLEPIKNWSQQRQLNPVLVTALIRQESRFEPAIESVAGATGLMQVMPETADWIAQQIDLQQYALSNPDDNIKLGTWYLDYTHQEYSGNSLFAVASYNAGPGNVADWIARNGFSDPDEFVEAIPFPETQGYVKSVFENYWNYLRLYNPEVSRQLASRSPVHSSLVGSAPRRFLRPNG